MAKGKLKAALDQHKGVDYKLERQKKLQKEAAKKKAAKDAKASKEALEIHGAHTQDEAVEEQLVADLEEAIDSDSEDGGVKVHSYSMCSIYSVTDRLDSLILKE
jgi:rRNA-processing protein EBP2